MEIEGMRAPPAARPAVPDETGAIITRFTRVLLRSALLLRRLRAVSILHAPQTAHFLPARAGTRLSGSHTKGLMRRSADSVHHAHVEERRTVERISGAAQRTA